MTTVRTLLQKIAAPVIRPCRSPKQQERPPQATVFIVRHDDMRGPLRAFVSLTPPPHLWVLDVFFHFGDCYRQYRDYTFSLRQGKTPRRVSPKAALAALIAVPLVRLSGAVAVRRGKRALTETFQETNALLKDGESIVIAADMAYTNRVDPVETIYTGFFHLEKAYFEDTGCHLPFVPLVFDHKNRCLKISPPLTFSGTRPFFSEKKDLARAVMDFLNQNQSR